MASFISVLLHLVRSRASFQRILGHHIPACGISSIGGQAIFNCMCACNRRPLEHASGSEMVLKDEQSYTVEKYLRQVKAAIDGVILSLSRREDFSDRELSISSSQTSHDSR